MEFQKFRTEKKRESAEMMNYQYKIGARILCDDVRLNAEISTMIEAESEPSEQEIWARLNQAAEPILVQNSGEGCLYQLSEIKITKL